MYSIVTRAFVCYISINCLLHGEWSVPKIYYISSNADRLDVLFLLLYHSTVYWSGAYPKFTIYHPTLIGATRAFCLLYINQLPTGVERTKNLLYIIQRRALFVCYISFNCLLEWSVPKMYYISSNADWSDSRFSFVFISINCLYQWSVPKM
jgi:hypothetical protein